MNRTLRNTLWALGVNTICLLAFMPFAAQAASIAGSGTAATEVRQTGEFRGIAQRGSIDVEVRQGATAVSVTADDNLLPYLETVVEGGTLQVRWKSGTSLRGRVSAKVSVATPKLQSLASSGSGDFRVEAFNAPALKVTLSGSGDVSFNALATDDLAITISGSSDVRGNGRATRLSIGISGSGDVKLGEMKSDEVSVRIAGSGDAEVNAAKSLDVSIAGSGDVLYSGDAALKTRVAGSGTVRKR